MREFSVVNELNMSPTLKVVGRIHPETVWNYVNEIREIKPQDVVFFYFTPMSNSDSKESYFSFLSQMKQNKWFAVIEAFSETIKDFYIAAFHEDSSSNQCNNFILRFIV